VADFSRLGGGGAFDTRHGGESRKAAVHRLLSSILTWVPDFFDDLRQEAHSVALSRLAHGRAIDDFMAKWHLVLNWDAAGPLGLGLRFAIWDLARAHVQDDAVSWATLLHELRARSNPRLPLELRIAYEGHQRALYIRAVRLACWRRLLRAARLRRAHPGPLTRDLPIRVRNGHKLQRVAAILGMLAHPNPTPHSDMELYFLELEDIVCVPPPPDFALPKDVHRDNPAAPVEFDPLLDTRESARERFERHCDERIRIARELGFPPAPMKLVDDHFDWFARYQVGGKSYSDIGSDRPYRDGRRSASVRTVENGIGAIANLIGLRRRRGRPGRRRSTPTHDERRTLTNRV
jgi:hypothetical protein